MGSHAFTVWQHGSIVLRVTRESMARHPAGVRVAPAPPRRHGTLWATVRRSPLNGKIVRRLDVGMNINTDSLIGTIDIGPRDVEDWRECTVVMRADGFSAEYTCSVRDEELRHFLSQLEDALARLGQAVSFEFRALERGFAFEIEMGRGGHVDGKYRFERDGRGPCLSGSLAADQTHLAAWATELRSALAT